MWDAEVSHWKELVDHIRNESDVKYKAMKIEKDGLQAQYVDAKDIFICSKNKSKLLKREHAEYERVIHEIGGSTISKVEMEAMQVVEKCIKY